MKILLVNGVYNIGSTGKIVSCLKEQYTKLGHDVYVAYGRHSSIKDDPKVFKCAYELESKIFHLISLFTGNIYGNMFFSTKKLIRQIKRIKPDVVHLHCLNGYFVNIYKLLNFLKKNEINTVLTNHAEFMYTANCGYSIECNNWIDKKCINCKRIKEFNGKFSLNRTHHFYNKMERAFANFNSLTVTNVSPWLTERAKKSPFFKNNKVVTVLNPVNIFDENLQENPYSNYKINKDSKIILFVTAAYDNPEKGGFFISKVAKLLEKENYHLFVKSALQPKAIEKLPNVTYITEDVGSSQLASLYRYADTTILLSIRETFSMIVAESLIQGTPVVGFLAGGPESICIPEYCSFSKYGDLELLANNIKKTLEKSINRNEIILKAKEKYSIDTICDEYLKLYGKNI